MEEGWGGGGTKTVLIRAHQSREECYELHNTSGVHRVNAMKSYLWNVEEECVILTNGTTGLSFSYRAA